MNSRFRSNNLVAILIAIILFATGFALYFIHKQSESGQQQDKAPTAFFSEAPMATERPEIQHCPDRVA
jgi:hypothetical protein